MTTEPTGFGEDARPADEPTKPSLYPLPDLVRAELLDHLAALEQAQAENDVAVRRLRDRLTDEADRQTRLSNLIDSYRATLSADSFARAVTL